MSKFLVYGLVDPRTLLVRYVGKSQSGLDRPRAHGTPATLRRNRFHCGNWLRELAALGLKYEIAVLETCSSKFELSAAECWWISYGRACGWPLTNLTDGGDGNGRVETPDMRRRRSEAYRGRDFLAPEARARQAASARAWWTPERRAAARDDALERAADPELRRRISERTRASVTDEHREAASERIRRTWSNPESRARMMAGRSERARAAASSRSRETRAKLSAAALARWADPVARTRYVAALTGRRWTRRKAAP